jgi:DNA-binding CsgD family transcriptional regulator/tetratricopeptide (TPR) repeat protein
MIAPVVRCSRLVGRAGERKYLIARLEEAANGRGSVVVLGGEPGLGKSRLLDDVAAFVEAEGACSVIAHCFDGAHSPLAPIVDALRELDARAPEVLSAAHPVRRLFAFEETRGAAPADVAGGARRDYYAGIVDALRAFARVVPLFLGVEDVHWADAETLAFLRFLTTKVHGARILAVATYRSTELAEPQLAQFVAAVGRAPAGGSLSLRPLDREAMADFIDDALREHPNVAPSERRDVRLRAEGNPLFAEELLCHLLDPSTERLPPSVQAAVRARVATLERAHAEVLEQAAVLGRTFAPAFLAAVVELPSEEVEAALRSGREAQLVVEEREAGLWSFRHTLLREGLYEALTSSEAKRLHARIARHLEELDAGGTSSAELAHQWSAAGDAARAAVYNERAGDAAMAVHGTLDAADFYARALVVAPSGSADALRVGLKLGTALDYSGYPERARAALEVALHVARSLADAPAIVEISTLIARQFVNQMSTLRAIATLEQGIEDLGGWAPAAAPLVATLAWLHALRGESAVALGYVEEAESQFDAVPAIARLELLDARGVALGFEGDVAGAAAAFDKAVELAAANGGRWSTRALTNRSFIIGSLGDVETSVLAADEALRIMRDSWAVSGAVPFVLSIAAGAHLRAGNVGMASATVREAEVLAMEADYGRLNGHVAVAAFALAARTGDPGLVARYDIDKLVDDTFASGEPAWMGGLAAGVGEWLAACGEKARLSALLARTCANLRTAALSPELIVLACMHGDDAVRVALRRLLHPWRPEGCGELAAALFALLDACEPERSHDERVASARAAATGFAACHLPFEEGCALELAGDSSRASSAYRRAGSSAHVARLAANAPAGPQADRLSKRERQVADLLAGGATNRSIAQTLGVSERTVETHLHSVYQKLGVASRLELVTRLYRPLASPTDPPRSPVSSST